MEYEGAKKKLEPGQMAKIAAEYGVQEAHIRTVIDVETSGRAYNSVGWPDFLFEPHKFYQNVPKSKLAEAIKQGLAYPRWKGPGSYPKTPALRVAQFKKAAELDETAAIKSASWGLGQILGSECVEAGYTSPQEMLQAFMDSEEAQIRGMLNLCKHRGLIKDLLAFPDMSACRHFALRYNGAKYEQNNYHVKLHDAFIRWRGREEDHGHTDPAPDGTVRFGDRDTEEDGPVRQIQNHLRDAGYSLKVDGKFGPGTRTAILAWKANEGMDTSSADMTLADQEMLKKASPMPVPEERANATVSDLKPKSDIIQKASLGKRLMAWVTGILGGTSALDATGALDKAQNTVDKAKQAKDVLSQAQELAVDSGVISLLKTVYDWRFVILLGVAIAAFFIYDRIQKKRLEMHQKAELA